LTAKILNMATAEAFDSIQLKHIPDRKWISKGLKNIRIETGARIELQLRRELRNIIVKIDRRMEDLFDVTEVDLFKVIEAQMSKLVVTSHLFITGSPESREKAKQYLVQHMAQWVNVEAYLSECSGMKYQNYFKRLIPQYLGNYTYN
jgi:NhaP-type Na+/H+ and K+/H+ antiporter